MSEKLQERALAEEEWVFREAAPVTSGKKRRGGGRPTRLLAGALIPVLMLISWELSARLGWSDPRFFGQPSTVAEQAGADIREGLLWDETRVTLVRLLLGFLLGSVSGVVVGLVLSQSTWLRMIFEPIIRALYVVPKLALLPIFLLVFGIGETPKLVFVGLGTFYIVAFTTLAAAMMIPVSYYEVTRSYGLSRAQGFRWMILPACLPQVVSSLRIATGISTLLVIAVEFVSSNDGLGHYTWHAWQLFLPERMYVGVVTISVIGVLFSLLVGAVGKRLVRWSDEEFSAQR
ncbi:MULTISPECIES: ABC transporter permease [Streptomyces]|uniref:ABC transporter permease n=1 Tax=Streptomyces doudnae TaxID=3075536 RepID=A0ABD5EWC1_9ACTN|nr:MULTISPECIES: ABC transporter permease [unclassified Streptomyces]MDT0438649.1 ABC transporter permease [Streptomyces sp. DSM 41981]MYQ69075.1 ABC transporter permease subunit [Streptomyces sp. SID4950]SCE51173.1 NitT/TauT family transport system permease protein/sulfonate transport system permease protein [Streptomyces sp. SolWspMP-5a-2]